MESSMGCRWGAGARGVPFALWALLAWLLTFIVQGSGRQRGIPPEAQRVRGQQLR